MAKKLAFDKALFTIVVLLLLAGLVMVYSTSSIDEEEASSLSPFLKQLLAAGVGLVAMATAMYVNYRYLRHPAVIYALLGGSVLLLVGVLFYGPLVNDTRRWLFLGRVSVQPSEIGKLVLIAFLAYQVDRKWGRINQPSFLIPSAFIAGLMALLVLMEPDYGTAAILLTSAALLLFLAGVAWRYLLAAGLLTLPVLVFLAVSVPYRRERLFAYLFAEQDALNSGYQILQSLIAVGSGGPFGLGLGKSVQKLHFVPMAESDFIFSIVCEELGMLGGLGVLALFGLLVWRGVVAGLRAPDNLGRFLAWGLTQTLVLQALLNISVTLGLLPITGTPLPFFSYGGSSLVTTLTACGVLLNVSQHG